MAGEAFDHLVGLIAIGTIFISAVIIIPSMSYVNMLYVDQQQLRNTALETLKATLLGKGYPNNWGSLHPFDQNDINSFGLAYADSPSFYVLDPDKVQRLVQDNPIGYIKYDKMRKLLGLEGYGFSLSITPPFNITVENLSTLPNLRYEVTISKNNPGTPIPNANVDATIVYLTKQGDEALVHFKHAQSVRTNAMGWCEILETLDEGTIFDVMVVVKVTVAGVSTVVATYQSTPPNDIAEVNVVGDNIILTMPDVQQPPARWVDNIIAIDDEGLAIIYNGTRSNDDKLNEGHYREIIWSFTNSNVKNPLMFIFNFRANDPARRGILIAGPNPNLMGSRVREYGGNAAQQSSSAVIKLQRNVVISKMMYIAQIAFWKET